MAVGQRERIAQTGILCLEHWDEGPKLARDPGKLLLEIRMLPEPDER